MVRASIMRFRTKFVRFGVKDHVVKRLRIAVENRCHHPMRGLGHSIAKHLPDFVRWTVQEGSKRSIG